jgi:hypothetical protein
LICLPTQSTQWALKAAHSSGSSSDLLPTYHTIDIIIGHRWANSECYLARDAINAADLASWTSLLFHICSSLRMERLFHRDPTTVGAALSSLFVAYICLVRALRWRRFHDIHRKYEAKWKEGKLTPAEAQRITLVSSMYDMPLLLNKALSFALFKTYAIVSRSKNSACHVPYPLQPAADDIKTPSSHQGTGFCQERCQEICGCECVSSTMLPQ